MYGINEDASSSGGEEPAPSRNQVKSIHPEPTRAGEPGTPVAGAAPGSTEAAK